VRRQEVEERIAATKDVAGGMLQEIAVEKRAEGGAGLALFAQ
jgi:hypothetical protein